MEDANETVEATNTHYPYPPFILELCKPYENKYTIYVLEVSPGVYKFGITESILTRLRTHYRKLRFVSIVKIFECSNKDVVRNVETRFKKYAKSIKILVATHGLTEIIHVDDIKPYLNWFQSEIDTAHVDDTARCKIKKGKN